MKQGILFIVSAPSGTGKSSLIREFLKTTSVSNTKVSISHTTRMIRPGESEGQHYYFISKKQFQKMIHEKVFLEYAKVFNHYYGTSKKTIITLLSNGIDVFLDIDWQGAQQIRNIIKKSCSIFLLPPSKSELYRRLKFRNQDTDLVISKRMEQAISEIMHYKEYDYVIVNDNFSLAVSELETIIRAERLCVNHQKNKYDIFVKKLINE